MDIAKAKTTASNRNSPIQREPAFADLWPPRKNCRTFDKVSLHDIFDWRKSFILERLGCADCRSLHLGRRFAAIWKVASQIRWRIFSQRDKIVDAGLHALRGWKLRSEYRWQLGHSCTGNSSFKSLPTSGHATRTSHPAESHRVPRLWPDRAFVDRSCCRPASVASAECTLAHR